MLILKLPRPKVFLLLEVIVLIPGDLYIIDTNSVTKPHNKRKKRMLDIAFSLLFIVFAPLLIFPQKNKIRFLSNSFLVLFGVKTRVGYGARSSKELPTIKESVLTPANKLKNVNLDEEQRKKLNLIYSKDYKIENDLVEPKCPGRGISCL